jgi:hypothetical protein
VSRPIQIPGEPTITRLPGPLTWREKTVIRILLIVARMLVVADPQLVKDIEHLGSHISVSRSEETGS